MFEVYLVVRSIDSQEGYYPELTPVVVTVDSDCIATHWQVPGQPTCPLSQASEALQEEILDLLAHI